MYLNLDILYNIYDHFNPLLYYSNSPLNYHVVYNKITNKSIMAMSPVNKTRDFLWIDILNNTNCFNFGGWICKTHVRKIVISEKEFLYRNSFCVKRTKKQIKLPIPDYDFLFNNIRLTAGSFSSYEKQIK